MGDVAFIVLQPHADLSVEQPADFFPDLGGKAPYMVSMDRRRSLFPGWDATNQSMTCYLEANLDLQYGMSLLTSHRGTNDDASVIW